MLDETYPRRPDGRTFFPFRRVFVVAQVGSAALIEQLDHLRHELVDVGAGGVEHQIGVLGWLVWRVDAGQSLELAGPRPRVEAFGIAALALGERRATRTPR